MRSATALMLNADEPVLRFEEGSRTSVVSSFQATSATKSETHDNDPYTSLKRKQEELLKIRQQLEKTERETSQLETLRRKEERFDTGRREMTEKLSRSLSRLERDLYNTQKAIEEISAARDIYQRHLDVMRGLQPEAWQRGNMDDEMDRAIGAIDDAESEYGKTSRRLVSVLPGEHSAATMENNVSGALPQNFAAWMRCGLAFTLPLIVALVLFFVISHFIH
jgi:chromosome segregation ATPase